MPTRSARRLALAAAPALLLATTAVGCGDDADDPAPTTEPFGVDDGGDDPVTTTSTGGDDGGIGELGDDGGDADTGTTDGRLPPEDEDIVDQPETDARPTPQEDTDRG